MRTHGSTGGAISLDAYIETERAGMTAGRLTELAGFSSRIFAKLTSDQARQHRDLHQGARRLMKILDPELIGSYTDPLPVHLAEAGVALAYLLKGMDLIPDSIPEIGLSDDAHIVKRVLARNPKLRSRRSGAVRLRSH